MKKQVFVALTGLCLLGACQGNESAGKGGQNSGLPPVTTFKGQLQYGAGKVAFRDCANDAIYAVADSTLSLNQLYPKACQPVPCPGEPALISAKGRLFGSAAENNQVLAIVAVDSITPRNFKNSCSPYNYWCHGTEPFWSLVVDPRSGGLFFKDLSTEKGHYYTWQRPTLTSGNTTTFVVHEYRNEEAKLTLYIRPEPANDGMSDQKYNYSATVVTPDGRTLRGVAVAWDEHLNF